MEIKCGSLTQSMVPHWKGELLGTRTLGKIQKAQACFENLEHYGEKLRTPICFLTCKDLKRAKEGFFPLSVLGLFNTVSFWLN